MDLRVNTQAACQQKGNKEMLSHDNTSMYKLI